MPHTKKHRQESYDSLIKREMKNNPESTSRLLMENEMHEERMNAEAKRRVRKSESGRYEGQDLSNLEAAGNDEDGESLKKKKK